MVGSLTDERPLAKEPITRAMVGGYKKNMPPLSMQDPS